MEAKGQIFLLTHSSVNSGEKWQRHSGLGDYKRKWFLITWHRNSRCSEDTHIFITYNLKMQLVSGDIFFTSLYLKYPQVIKKAHMHTNKWYVICEVRAKFGSEIYSSVLHYIDYSKTIMSFFFFLIVILNSGMSIFHV